MNKKIIVSAFTIFAAVAVVAGATTAFFSATDSVAGNSVATGTLSVDIDNGVGKPIALSNIAPGYVDDAYRLFDVKNDGTLPAEFFMLFSMTGGDINLFNALDIELKDGGVNGLCDGVQFYNASLSAFLDNTKVSQNAAQAAASSSDTVVDNILAGSTMRICQKISFPETTLNQNNLQGTSVTFDEVINSRQDLDPDALP